MICDTPNCLFVHIPKTAGQSVEQVFLDLNHLSWAESERSQLLLRPNNDPTKGPPRLAHLLAREYLSYGYVGSEEFSQKYKFSFVRNPWDRLVSEYLYAHRSLYDFREFLLHRFPVPEADNYDSCADGYRHVVEQYDFLYDQQGNCLVDFVGRFENLQSDFNKISQALSLEPIPLKKQNTFEQNVTNFAIQQGQVKPGQSVKINKPHYSAFYDEETQAFVAARYARDIAHFGYCFEQR